jgi:hypothetical protein
MSLVFYSIFLLYLEFGGVLCVYFVFDVVLCRFFFIGRICFCPFLGEGFSSAETL